MCNVLIHARLQGLVAAEEEFSAITDKIPQRPVTVTEAGGYSLVIVAALGVSVVDAWRMTPYCAFLSIHFSDGQMEATHIQTAQACPAAAVVISFHCCCRPLNPPWRHSCLAAAQFAGAVAYAALNELLFQPKEYQARLGVAAALLGCHLGQCSALCLLARVSIHIPHCPYTPLTPPARPTSCAPALPLSLAVPARLIPHAQPTPPAQAQHLPVCMPAAAFISSAIARPTLLLQCFNHTLAKIKDDPRVTVRLGERRCLAYLPAVSRERRVVLQQHVAGGAGCSLAASQPATNQLRCCPPAAGTPISAYGQESQNRAARQRIPHRCACSVAAPGTCSARGAAPALLWLLLCLGSSCCGARSARMGWHAQLVPQHG